MDYRSFFDSHGIYTSSGLSKEEFLIIKDIYNIEFPNELKKIYSQALPVSDGFYNWRDFSADNVIKIKNAIEKPYDDFKSQAMEMSWPKAFGEFPKTEEEYKKVIDEKVKSAPKLIPIFTHRYMPSIIQINNPVLAIYGVEAFVAGRTLEEYISIEFSGNGNVIFDYEPIQNIPFWKEVINL